MKPEQLNWTDKEWASHLRCDVRDIPALRKWLKENYFPGIATNQDNGNHLFYMSRLDFAPSGAKRIMPVMLSNKEFDTEPQAIKHANEVIIPSLEFNPIKARLMGVPQRALHMLHIAEKQK